MSPSYFIITLASLHNCSITSSLLHDLNRFPCAGDTSIRLLLLRLRWLTSSICWSMAADHAFVFLGTRIQPRPVALLGHRLVRRRRQRPRRPSSTRPRHDVDSPNRTDVFRIELDFTLASSQGSSRMIVSAFCSMRPSFIL